MTGKLGFEVWESIDHLNRICIFESFWPAEDGVTLQYVRQIMLSLIVMLTS